jgi:hypothetical protein
MASQFDPPPLGSVSITDAHIATTLSPSKITGTAATAADIATHAGLTTGVHGSATSTLVYGNDSRLTDARQLAAGTDKTKLNGIATGAVADHVNIANKGMNTHAQIDTFIGTKGTASGLASLDANSKLAQLRARADDGLGYALLTNDTLAQNYAVNSVTKLTVTANRTLTTTVPPAGCAATTLILTAGTVSFTITFGTGFKPTATLATGAVASRVFAISWISDGTNLYETGRTAAMVA